MNSLGAEKLHSDYGSMCDREQVGLITPRATVNVPHVRIPMAFWQPSEMVLVRLIKVGSSECPVVI